ncbi:cation:proton antiporter [Streptomyces sp. NPDC096198]|uniref:cation:proton antiporter n=1 Tax=Streptomyces sp. NPDC096198 TaxID=3366080 RepID=UPI0037F1096A
MSGTPLTTFFLLVAAAMGTARLLGSVARRLGQPPLIGEIVAGLLASPTLLAPLGVGTLIPAEVRPGLTALADLGLAALMFVIGYELDASALRGRHTSVLGLTAGSILLPLVAGGALAVPMARDYAAGDPTVFVVFVGVALSITAFPVLARVLADRGLTSRPLGTLTLASASLGDLIAWLCLAAVAAWAGSSGQARIVALPGYLLLLHFAVRPLLAALVRRAERRNISGSHLLPVFLVGLMGSCAATEWLGVHFVFGAFAFGAVMPRGRSGGILPQVEQGMSQVGHLLLPLYFFLAGTAVDLSGFGGGDALALAAVVGTAVAAKMAGAYAGARCCGLPHGTALPAAVLMNTRGLTEIVIAAAALDMHIIDRDFYSIMVVMALLTTAMTGPLLNLLGVPAHTGRGHGAAPAGPTWDTAQEPGLAFDKS